MLVIELAPGKVRQLQHMSATTFWSPDGKPMSAADFIRQLYGDLPALFQDEETLRELWSRPDTRQGLLDSLAEKGYGAEQLKDIGRLANAENSDLLTCWPTSPSHCRRSAASSGWLPTAKGSSPTTTTASASF